jgi:glycosyltransferase involved in cell wall biosynthesis
MEVVPNWADGAALCASATDVDALRAEWGLQGRRVVMYSGNLGRAHTFQEILTVAEHWKTRDDTVILFIGGGHAWNAAERQARRRNLTNVLFKPYQDRLSLGVSLSVGDVHLVTQKPETVGLLVPSKLYGILAVGRPVVFFGPVASEVAITLKETGAGFTVVPGDVDGLQRTLESLLGDNALRQDFGDAGRSYMAKQGNRAFRTDQYRKILESAAGR